MQTDAKIKEILAALEFNEGIYQREAVDAAITRKEEIIPCWCGSGKKYKHCHLKSDRGS